MEEDTPEDRVLGVLAEAQFPDHPLGREVLGTRATIESMPGDDIRSFHRRWYRPCNLVVSAAGAVDHDVVVAGVGSRLRHLEGGTPPVRSSPPEASTSLEVRRRRTEQVHLAVGVRGFARHDPDRTALAVADQVLGGGPSSRLFQEIRERRGLTYDIDSHVSSWSDTGSLVVYAATAPTRAVEVLGLVHAELDRLVAGGVTERELVVAKGYLEGSTVLAMEDAGSRMARIGASLLLDGVVVGVDELVARFRAVTAEDVVRAVARVLGPGDRSVAVLGSVPKRDLARPRAA